MTRITANILRALIITLVILLEIWVINTGSNVNLIAVVVFACVALYFVGVARRRTRRLEKY